MKSFLSDKRRLLLSAAIGMLLAIMLVTLLFSGQDKKPLSETRFMLDTICTVTLYEWPEDGGRLIDGAFELCRRYEGLLSTTVSGSDIFRLNHSHGRPVEVSRETAALLERAVRYGSLSNGAFDITIYPVKTLWDFSGDAPSLPDAKALASAASKVDYTKIRIDGTTVTLPAGMGIDLGAIAKGFIADRVAEYLRERDVGSAVIDLGGNVYAIGSKPDGTKWRVGIRQPFGEGEADVVETADASVVTSGVYQRYFEQNGKLYHHILRASDGMPCATGLYSVTVISASSEQCDALSTACMLLGYESSVSLLSAFPDTKAIFITADNQLLYYPSE